MAQYVSDNDRSVGRAATAQHAALSARLRAAGCVFAEDEADILLATSDDADELDAMASRRATGLPLEHVVGWASFAGERLVVEPGVFVPRRRSEFLVRCVLDLVTPDCLLVDLCCGSGAIGAVAARRCPGLELYLVDIDEAAVRCARRNVAADVGTVLQGDLDQPLPAALRGRVDLLVANAPYVPSDEIRWLPPEARDHEPAWTLDGGPDGVDIQRRVAALAPGWLAPDGRVLIETSVHQAPLTCAALVAAGLSAEVLADDADATVVIAHRR